MRALWGNPDMHAAAFRREFDRVRNVIEKNLLHASGIDDHGRYVGVDRDVKLQTLAGGQPLNDVADFADEPRSVDGNRSNLHRPGLDLREVQRVVDQLEEMIRT